MNEWIKISLDNTEEQKKIIKNDFDKKKSEKEEIMKVILKKNL